MNELQELIIKSEELLDDLEKDKDVKEQNWWLDQRAQLAEAIDNAKKSIRGIVMATLEEIEKELEDIPLTEHEWDMIEWLIAEVKRLREENAKIKAEHRLMKISIAQKNAACSEIHFGDDTNQ